jgi:periplasmic protein TonB
MSISLRLLLVKLLPIAASLLLHAAACGAIMLAPGWAFVRESVIVLELVDPQPAVQPTPPAPPKPDRRPVTPPKPVYKPLPRPEPSVARPDPPVSQPEPAAQPERQPVATPKAEPEPSATAGRGPLAPIDAPAASAAVDSLPPDSTPAAPSTPVGPARPASSSVAALPPGDTPPNSGITQSAAPRGGYQVKPSYPSSARRAGMQGTTLLGVFVGSDGRVGDVVVRESAGHPDLDAAAVDAVKRWRFEPARRGTEPVAMWVLLPVQFTLR